MAVDHGKRRNPKQAAFLAAIARTANVTKAARIASCDRDRHYAWMRDPEYATLFADAWERGVQFVEAAAVRRAEAA